MDCSIAQEEPHSTAPGLHHLLLDDASRANGCLRVRARIANHLTELPDWRRWAEQTRAIIGGVLPV